MSILTHAAAGPGYRIQLDTVCTGFDRKTCWVHPRAGTIPGSATRPPSVVMTMQKLLLAHSDVFYALHEMRTDDLGRTWRGPLAHADTLGRRSEPRGIEAQICDATPRWHAATGKLLMTGQVARYLGDDLMPPPRPRHTAYAVYEPAARTWSEWRTMDMPEGDRFFSAGAGSSQRYDLAGRDGDILLPIYYQTLEQSRRPRQSCYSAMVVRCRFDGATLTPTELGEPISAPEPRGLYEPSLTRFGGRFLLTLRNDSRGYVAAGDDGLRFDAPRPWTFDDGAELGNYNTQQHWVTHSDALYLVYTRRGLNNDHVFRHRAPLLIAQVDPNRLCVLRDTERVLVPERGARLGNFTVTDVSPQETWVTVAEWMQTNPPRPTDYTVCQRYGSDNAVFAARILWDKPNRTPEAAGGA